MELIKGLKIPLSYIERVLKCRHCVSNVVDIQNLFPFLDGPMEIVNEYNIFKSLSESDVFLNEKFSAVESSIRSNKPIEFPFLDYDKSLIISINKVPGDDLAIALDYRFNEQNPCVVATDFTKKLPHAEWVLVAHNINDFLDAIGWGAGSD